MCISNLAAPGAALLKPFEDRLRRVELSVCGFDDVDEIMCDDVLKRIRSESMVMQDAGECAGERPSWSAAGAGYLPENWASAIRVDVKLKEVLGEPLFGGLPEELGRLGPCGFYRLGTEPIRYLALNESGQTRSPP